MGKYMLKIKKMIHEAYRNSEMEFLNGSKAYPAEAFYYVIERKQLFRKPLYVIVKGDLERVASQEHNCWEQHEIAFTPKAEHATRMSIIQADTILHKMEKYPQDFFFRKGGNR